MTKLEQALLKQLDSAYNQVRFEAILKMQNRLAKEIIKSRMPSQDALMVLTLLSKQIEESFIKRVQPKQESK